MKIIGITGGIGSGKTTVCKIFELLGVPVFYADVEAKKLYDDKKVKAQIVMLFGKSILNSKKEIDKQKLGQIVFSDKTSLNKLNKIIHPRVRAQFRKWIIKQKGAKYIIEEAAILIESGAHKEVDYLISITSPKELRIKRVNDRSKMNISEIIDRMKVQLSDKQRAKYSDAIIVNDEKHSLIEQALKIHQHLLKI